MTKELIIPTDDPSVMKAFDPYSVQGMVNAFTFFARENGKDVRAKGGMYGTVYIMDPCDGVQIILRPTSSNLATQHVLVTTVTPRSNTSLSIFNPDKVEYDEGEAIKFYARDPPAVLTLAVVDGTLDVDLKVTDMQHPERVHGGTYHYYIG